MAYWFMMPPMCVEMLMRNSLSLRDRLILQYAHKSLRLSLTSSAAFCKANT
jgi:hypothetical protein